MEEEQLPFDDVSFEDIPEEATEENEINEENQLKKEAKEQKKPKKETRVKHETHNDREAKKVEHIEEEESNMWGDTGLWRFVGIALLVLLIVSIFTNGFHFGTTTVKNTLSKEAAAKQAMDFINTNLLQPGLTVALQGNDDVGDLYKLKLAVGGQIIDSYVTKDGRLFFPQGLSLTEAKPNPSPTQQPAAPAPTKVDVSADDDPFKGNKDAPITIIEFSDFQCPFCERFFSGALPEIEEKYIKTGKAKLVFRDFPLESIHPNARPAAEAANCANEQGKFWEFHDQLFKNQASLSDSNYKLWAQQLGLDSKKFNDCVDTKKYAAEVSKDLADGNVAGVSGTPAFYVNGKELSGAQPFTAFQQVIEAELAAMKKPAEAKPAAPAEAKAEANAAPAPAAVPAVPIPAEATDSSVKEFTIAAKKFRFDPSTIKVKKGDKVKLNIQSSDVPHGFLLPAFNVNQQIQPGQTAVVEFVADKTGTFGFSCNIAPGTSHDLMKGTIVVE